MMVKSKNYMEHEELLRLVERTGIDVYDFENKERIEREWEEFLKGIEIRRRCFQTVFHYAALNGIDGKPVPLDEASNEILCKAFAGHYKRARKSHNPNQGLLFKIYEYK